MHQKLPRIERRLEPTESRLARALTMLLAVVVALGCGAFLFIPFGANPLEGYTAMLRGGFGTIPGIGFTLNKATPLMFVALATALAWRSGFFYVGYDGSLNVGALMAVWLALATGRGGLIGPLPASLFFPMVIVGGFIAGGLWACIPGGLRVRFKGNELLVSLMMNFVAALIVSYLVAGPMRASGATPETPLIPEKTSLPSLLPGSAGHVGFLLALAAAVFVWILLRKSVAGYELVLVGFNLRAAEYAGVNVKRRLLLAALIAGGLSGLAGLGEVLGVHHLLESDIASGVGFLGIGVALLGGLEPLGIVIASILYGGMSVGALSMQITTGVPSSVVTIVESLIVLGILASRFLLRYRVNFRRTVLLPKGDIALKTDDRGDVAGVQT